MVSRVPSPFQKTWLARYATVPPPFDDHSINGNTVCLGEVVSVGLLSLLQTPRVPDGTLPCLSTHGGHAIPGDTFGCNGQTLLLPSANTLCHLLSSMPE